MKANWKKFGLVILLFWSTLTAFSQNKTIDSLKILLSTKAGTELIDTYFELARAYSNVDNKFFLAYGREAYRLALKSGDSLRIVKTGRLTAQGLRKVGQIDSALVLFDEMLGMAKRHKVSTEHKTILNAMGTAYMIAAQQDKALECYFESLALSEQDNDEFLMGVILNNIGLIYLDLSDYQKAMTYLKRSLSVKEKNKEKYDIEGVLINIALCAAMQDNLNEGNEFINRVRSVCKDSCPTETLEYMYNVSGILLFKEGNVEDAEEAFQKSKRLNEVFSNDKITFSNLSYLLTISLRKNQTTLAQQYLNEIENLIASRGHFNFEIIDIYPQVFSYYLKLKEYEKAAHYQNKYFILRDSIYNKQLTINLMKVEANHLEKENLAKIESQNKVLKLNAEVIRTHELLNIFIGLVALLLIILTVVLIKSNRLKQKHNMLLDKKVQERTHQLQLNHDSLQRASLERDILLQKISTDINTALVTLKGLCSLGMKDIQDPHALEYISKMNTTSESFSNILTKLHFIRSGAGTLK